MKKIVLMALIASAFAQAAVLTGTQHTGMYTVCHYSDGATSSQRGMGTCPTTR